MNASWPVELGCVMHLVHVEEVNFIRLVCSLF